MFGVPKFEESRFLFVTRMWRDSTFWSGQTWFRVTTWRGDLDANLGYEVESGGVCSSGNIHGNIMEISWKYHGNIMEISWKYHVIFL